MSLVDYGSSEDEEVEEEHEPREQPISKADEPAAAATAAAATASAPPPSSQTNPGPFDSTHQQLNVVLPSSSVERLPDASLLLSSTSFSPQQLVGTDHFSRMAAAMAVNSSRKRELNGSASIHPHSKQPRGNPPQSRNIPETIGGALLPPQLRGRSNVVTEDIRKLFVNRNRESSS